jgi:hypothetical protein
MHLTEKPQINEAKKKPDLQTIKILYNMLIYNRLF